MPATPIMASVATLNQNTPGLRSREMRTPPRVRVVPVLKKFRSDQMLAAIKTMPPISKIPELFISCNMGGSGPKFHP